MTMTLSGTSGISSPGGDTNVSTTSSGNQTAAAIIPTGSTVPANGVFLPASNAVGLATNTAERMRINSSGNLLVGTTVDATGAKLAVNGALYQTGGGTEWPTLGAINAGNTYPSLESIGCQLAWNFTGGGREVVVMNGDTGGNGFRFLQRTGTSSSTYLGQAYANQSWYQGNNSSTWSTTSDVRIKQNIRPINSALEKMSALKPCHFEYIDKVGVTKTGFIAQEFETVFPGHIVEQSFIPDEYKEAIPEGEKIKGIDADLIPYLVKAIQEQQEQIEQLKAEVAALKGAK